MWKRRGKAASEKKLRRQSVSGSGFNSLNACVPRRKVSGRQKYYSSSTVVHDRMTPLHYIWIWFNYSNPCFLTGSVYVCKCVHQSAQCFACTAKMADTNKHRYQSYSLQLDQLLHWHPHFLGDQGSHQDAPRPDAALDRRLTKHGSHQCTLCPLHPSARLAQI